MNLIEGIQEEVNRCKELLEDYKRIPTGFFGAATIKQEILNAEKAIANDDIVRMISSHKKLKGFE